MNPTGILSSRLFIRGMMALAIGWLLANLLLLFSGVSVWDDAWMFERYAGNLRAGGRMSWNPGGEAFYGPTSLAWTLVVTAGGFILNQPAVLLFTLSLLAGLGFMVLLGGLGMHQGADRSGNRNTAIGFLLLSLGMGAVPLAVHFTSGMDTSLALVFLSGYVALWRLNENKLGPLRSLVLGLCGGLFWLVRPELTLFALVVPLVVSIASRRELTRGQGRMVLLFTLFTLALTWVLLMSLTGSFLPMSFYVKSGNPYGAEFFEFYRWVPLKYLGVFLFVSAPSWVAIAAATARFGKKWRQVLTPAELGIFISALLLIFYLLLGVLQVMPFYSRFYFFVFPAIVWTGLRCALALAEKPNPVAVRQPAALAALAVAALLMLAGWLVCGRPEGPFRRMGKFSLQEVYSLNGNKTWPGLDRLSALPGRLVIATTEVGLPGVMCRNKIIVDLAGLNDALHAGDRFVPAHLLNEQLPDVIYLPHPHYVQMNKTLRDAVLFRENYEVVPDSQTQTILQVALNKNSSRYAELREIFHGFGKTQ